MAELTNQEQLLVELINRARLDPGAEAARFGIGLNDGLTAGTLNGDAKQVLAPNDLLLDAARAHSQWIIDTDVFSHTGAGGSSPFDRMVAAGYAFNAPYSWGENIAIVGTSGSIDLTAMTLDMHENLFLSAGHRQNMLNGSFREIGAGIAQGVFQFSQGPFNSVDATENFAKSGTKVFFTGVCINDADGDDFYDVGEGRSGISVQVRQNATLAGSDSSGSAGGYAIGVAAGSYVVTFQGGGLANAVSCTVDATQGNVKLDLAGADEVLTSGSVVLGAGARNATLLGVAALNATGNVLANVLIGNKGANVLNGGAGADVMQGGAGNDTYLVDQAGDVVVESAGNGTDAIRSSVSIVLGANLENLVLTGSSGIDGSGNALNNLVVGNAAANVLDGGAGVDTVSYASAATGVTVNLQTGTASGGGGSDVLSNFEAILGSNFDDSLSGDTLNNTLTGGAGNDVLDGGAGIDTVSYGNAVAAVVVNLLAGTASGGAGSDTLFNFEAVVGSAYADTLTGNALNNTLVGGLGNDILDGGAGAGDVASYANAAGAIIVNLATGQASGAAGTDTLLNIESVIGSAYADTLSGNALANTLVGAAGADVLTGGAGADGFTFTSRVGTDTVTDFVSGSDKLRFSQAGLRVGDGDSVVDNALVVSGPGGFAPGNELVIVAANIQGAIGSAAAAAAIGSSSASYAVGQTVLFAVDNGTATGLFLFTSAGADVTVSAGELAYIATLSATPGTAVGDYLFVA